MKQNQYLSLQGQKSSTKQCMFSIKLQEDYTRTCRSDHAFLPITPTTQLASHIVDQFHAITWLCRLPFYQRHLKTDQCMFENRPCSKNTTTKQNSATNISPYSYLAKPDHLFIMTNTATYLARSHIGLGRQSQLPRKPIDPGDLEVGWEDARLSASSSC